MLEWIKDVKLDDNFWSPEWEWDDNDDNIVTTYYSLPNGKSGSVTYHIRHYEDPNEILKTEEEIAPIKDDLDKDGNVIYY
jgi:hypothetical protein